MQGGQLERQHRIHVKVGVSMRQLRQMSLNLRVAFHIGRGQLYDNVKFWFGAHFGKKIWERQMLTLAFKFYSLYTHH